MAGQPRASRSIRQCLGLFRTGLLELLSTESPAVGWMCPKGECGATMAAESPRTPFPTCEMLVAKETPF